MEKSSNQFSLNSYELLDYQPNRYPYLMIDFVTCVEPGKFAHGYKNLSNNEWFFPKHFPGHPNFPGALQLEALAQMLTVAITTLEGNKGKITYVISHKINLKREVFPGEKFDIKTEVVSWKRGICKGNGQGYVGEQLACEAEMVITIPEILESFLPRK